MNKTEYAEGEFVPMQFQGVRAIVRGMPGRVAALVWKLVSFQGIVLALGTWLVWLGAIESYAWLVVVLFVLFGRSGLDFIKEMKK